MENRFASLPRELLTEVFKNLKPERNIAPKKDLSSCLLVCKSWYFAAFQFFDEGIRLNIPDEAFNLLYKDLHNFPMLAHKISHLKLDKATTGNEKPETLRSIINLCSNLVELKFANNDIYHYLRVLNCPQTEMLNIRKIQITAIDNASPAVRRFHLWVNYRFRSTITHLEIADLDDNGALNNYGGLIKMVQEFPNLTHLKAKCLSRKNPTVDIHLTSLLNTCPLLQEIKLYRVGNIVLDNNESPKYDNITKLKLNCRRTDIASLKYIVSQFPNLQKLRLITSQITPDDVAFTNAEATAIINDFKNHAKSMKRSTVRCAYKNEVFTVDVGGSRPKYVAGQMFLDDIPEEFLQELLMMHDEWFDPEDEFFGFDDDIHEFEIEQFLEEEEEQQLYEEYLADMMYHNHIDEEEEMFFREQHEIAMAEEEEMRLVFEDAEEDRLALEEEAQILTAEEEEARLAFEEEEMFLGEPDEIDMTEEMRLALEDDKAKQSALEEDEAERLAWEEEAYREELEAKEFMEEQIRLEEEDRLAEQEFMEQVLMDDLAEREYWEEQHQLEEDAYLDHLHYMEEEGHLYGLDDRELLEEQLLLDEEERLDEEQFYEDHGPFDEQDLDEHFDLQHDFDEQDHFDDQDSFDDEDI